MTNTGCQIASLMAKRPSYEIPRPQPTAEFLQARNIAGAVLEQYFKKLGGKLKPSLDYRWIKADLTWPSFDHLTFAYGNQIFSVLVEVIDGEDSHLSEQECQRCFVECAKNNLIPCVFQVSLRDMKPLREGWNLLALETGLPIAPHDLVTDERIEMSEWELRNMAIQIVRDSVGQSSGKVLSFTDILGIDPQVWFEDKTGTRAWVIVRHYSVLSGDEAQEFVGIEKQHPQLVAFDGYFAAVSMASSEPFLYGRDGGIIPLSRRFDGSAPLYRGDAFYIKFDRLLSIHVP
jgi:hypothetical protein